MINYHFKCHVWDVEYDMSPTEVTVYYIRGFMAEFLGTFCLEFFGCACVKVLIPTMFGSPLCFGVVIGSVIQIMGPITLGHFNPAVSLSFYLFGIFSLPLLAVYIIAQVCGAVVGMFLAATMFAGIILGKDGDLSESFEMFCCTLLSPTVGVIRGFMWEYLLTMFLILLVCSVVDSRNFQKLDSMPLKFSFLMFTLIFIGNFLTGGSMNPARSFAPALIFGQFQDHWLYWMAPLLSSAITTVLYHLLFLPRDGQLLLKTAMAESALVSLRGVEE